MYVCSRAVFKSDHWLASSTMRKYVANTSTIFGREPVIRFLFSAASVLAGASWNKHNLVRWFNFSAEKSCFIDNDRHIFRNPHNFAAGAFV